MELRVQAEVAGELRHLERLARVRHDVGRGRVRQAVAAERVEHALDVGLLTPVLGVQGGPADALGRVLRVEVEREPDELSAVPARHRLGRWLADAAPGSDVVRPDVDDERAVLLALVVYVWSDYI